MAVTMTRSCAVAGAILAVALALATDRSPVRAQASGRVDFARDIRPLLNERCVGCHGPAQQQAGYRLDRKSTALGGVIRRNINAGSSESSRLYLRISGTFFGPQMPPTGALSPAEIDLVRRWIDEGAEWPDALANDAALPPVDAAAADLIRAIRRSPARPLPPAATLRDVVNKSGPGGSTPLMYAALYGDTRMVSAMLAAGADPKIANHAGATALMWSLEDPAITTLLLDAGADVNATSGFGRTALSMAAAQIDGTPLVKRLLERGATATGAALAAAAGRGDVESVQLLLKAGARDNGTAAVAALRENCTACLDAIVAAQPGAPMRGLLSSLAPPSGAGRSESLMEALRRGADVNARDDKGRPVLMRVAIVDGVTPEAIQALIDNGADVNAKTGEGLTALDYARRVNRREILDVLARNGATGSTVAERPLAFVKNNDPRSAVTRSLPLLQRTAGGFYAKAGCISCHHNTLTAVTTAAARRRGLHVDEESARQNIAPLAHDVEGAIDQALQGIVIFGGMTTTTGYSLMALSSAGHESDVATDATVRLLRLTQRGDGHWPSVYRPPSEASEFTATAVSLRGIQLYGTPRFRTADDRAIRAATKWLAASTPRTTEDYTFRLFGLTWAAADTAVRRSALRDLVALQRADGGWAQLPSLASDAYATGQALVALAEAHMSPTDPIYRRGVGYLLGTQLPDGSWLVKSRAHTSQAYFETGFPHGANQFISAAATNWATQALLLAARD